MVRVLKSPSLVGLAALVAFLAGASGSCAWAAGDPAKGEGLFKYNCSLCHNATANGANKVGPNLFGVVDRPAGTHPGYNYTQAMKSSGIVWSVDELKIYLTSPQKVVPNVRMTFKGFTDDSKRDDVIAYLVTLK